MHQERLRTKETKPVIITASQFRIRCSAIASIMGKLSGGVTQVQRDELEELREKAKGRPLTDNQYKKIELYQSKEKLTPIQEKELNELIEKSKGSPLTEGQQKKLAELETICSKKITYELPKGAKTYVEKWVKDKIIYQRELMFGNKYTKKGNDNEEEGIKLVEQYYNLGYIVKNENRIIGEFIEGECDVELKNCIIDVKNSYTHETFPIFETDLPNYDYWCQMQGYMELYNKPFALVCYLLTNASEDDILKECNNQMWILGLDEVNEELYEKVRHTMTYDNLSIKTRIKVFRVDRDDNYIQAVKDRVVMCREYAQKLIDDFKRSLPIQEGLIKP